MTTFEFSPLKGMLTLKNYAASILRNLNMQWQKSQMEKIGLILLGLFSHPYSILITTCYLNLYIY